MNEDKYKAALNNLKISKDFNEKTLGFLTSNELGFIKNKNNKSRNVYGIVMVMVSVVAVIWGMSFFNSNSVIELAHSTGNVKAQYINKAPSKTAEKGSSSSSSVKPSEYEIFNKYNTSIFKGTVKNIKNIKLEMGNGNEYYQAVATIKIDEVYRGNEKIGSTAKILLPCPIDNNIWVEDTEVVSKMHVGTIGIFMPIKYDGTEYKEENGAKFYFKDISDYGFSDGVSYAFLKTQRGIIYDESTYESLNRMSTLDDVKKYVLKMVKPMKGEK